jgi:hypothetical protein
MKQTAAQRMEAVGEFSLQTAVCAVE